MMSDTKYAIDVVLWPMLVPRTKYGNAVLERSPIMKRNCFVVMEVSVF